MGIQLHLASVNTCNARCHFCIYKSPENTLPKGVMDWDLFTKIIDEASGIPSIDQIAFSALGEPLLDTLLAKRVAYVSEKCPHWVLIEVYTNGTLLTPKRFEELKAAGMNGLSISINAINQEQHEAVMGLRGKFATVVQNARYACENRGDVDVRTKAVFSEDAFGEEHAVRFLSMWGKCEEGGHGQCVVERNWAGASRTLKGEIKDPDAWCGRATGQISILWDGTVSRCCFDPLATTVYGDLKTQSIKEIYNSPVYTQFREDHSNNMAGKYEQCRGCTRV